MVLENKAFPFKPDALFFVAHPTDTEYSIVVLQKSVHANIELPYSYLKEIVEQSGINSKVSALEARRRLKPFGNRMISCAYSGMVEFCQQQNIKPVWILLPSKPGETLSKDQIASHVRLAKEAGFIVLNLCDVYSNQDVKSCQVAEWDTHPNAKGHRLIADRLYEILRKRRDLIPLRLSAQSEASAKDILHPAGIYTLRSSAEK